jgi:membrane-associated phospholipid phosphatase
MTPLVLPHSDSPFDNRHDFLVVNGWARDSTWLHGFMTDYAKYGVVLLAVLLLVGYWLAWRSGSRDKVATALWAPIGALAAVAIAQPIAHAVDEKRPFVAIPHVLTLAHHSADPGFPSDHATLAGAIAVGLLLVSARLGVVAAILALLMAFARVYIGVHYPGDVLAGLGLGAVVVLLGYALVVPLIARIVEVLERTPLRPVLTSNRRPAKPTAAEPA